MLDRAKDHVGHGFYKAIRKQRGAEAASMARVVWFLAEKVRAEIDALADMGQWAEELAFARLHGDEGLLDTKKRNLFALA